MRTVNVSIPDGNGGFIPFTERGSLPKTVHQIQIEIQTLLLKALMRSRAKNSRRPLIIKQKILVNESLTAQSRLRLILSLNRSVEVTMFHVM